MKPQIINKNFRIVFQPKNKEKFDNKRRFFVSAAMLEDYIGKSNSEVVFKKVWNSKTDKIRLKFRENGIVDVYVK